MDPQTPDVAPPIIRIVTGVEADELHSLVDYLRDLLNIPNPLTSTIDPDVVPLSVDERYVQWRTAITGQSTMIGPLMQNRTSALRLNALEPDVFNLHAQINALRTELSTLRDVTTQLIADANADVATKIKLLNTQRQELETALAVEKSRNDLQDQQDQLIRQKDELQDAALQQLQLQQQATSLGLDLNTSKDEAAAAADTVRDSRIAALEAARVAGDAAIALNAANIEKQRLQQIADESNIEADRQLAQQAIASAAQAQATAVAAQQSSDVLKAKVTTDEATLLALSGQVTSLQTSLTLTNQNLATQTLRVDTVVSNISALQVSITATQAAVVQAQTTATNAQNAVTNLGNKVRVVLNVATPSVTLPSNGTLSVPITWTPAFSDINYTASVIRSSGGSAVTGFSILSGSKLTTSCTITMTNIGTLSLVVPAGTIDIILEQK